MRRPLLAIALDSADGETLTAWMDQGHLPCLAELRRRGSWSTIRSRARYAGEPGPLACTETLWMMFHTGVYPHRNGFWSTIRYDPRRYRCSFNPRRGFQFGEIPPFYALKHRRRVVVFDLPMTELRDDVEGLQVQGWGGHAPFHKPGSVPPGLLAELNRRHGRNEVLFRDFGYFWRRRFVTWLHDAMRRSIERRADATLDLMRRGDWNLFVTSMGEIHGAEHILWFAENSDHPVHAAWRESGRRHPLRDVFQWIDAALGRIVAAAPEANVLCFSLHGMSHNVTDLATMALLPELVYRWNFPGRRAIDGEDGPLSPPYTTGLRATWSGEVWRRRWLPDGWARRLLNVLPPWAQQPIFPFEQLQTPFRPTVIGEAMWIPATWYRRHWPRMRAFALPAFSDGWVRINLRGRDPAGQVSPDEYEAVCEDLTRVLLRCRNSRTGEPLVQRVLRTRRAPLDADPKLPAADLIVQWHEAPTDVVDSPELGRVGPLPYQRTGGHRPDGWLLAAGPDLPANRPIEDMEVVDLPPTILSLIGAAAPEYFDGRARLECSAAVM